MKKVKMSAVKLQLTKEKISDLAGVKGGGQVTNTGPGTGGVESESVCNDKCPSWVCTPVPTKTGGQCVESVDICHMTINAGCRLTFDPAGMTTC